MKKARKILATLLLAGAALACAIACFSSCGHTHSYTETVTAPTCTEDGFTTHTCECGDSYTDNPVQKLGHTESDWIVDKEASYEETGSQHKECTVCHDVLQTEDLPVLEKPASEGLVYALSPDKAYYVVIGIGACKDTDLIIPSTHEGKPVTTIGKSAFYNCDSLTSMVIGDSVTAIGIQAFSGCDNLTSVLIPNNVLTIGNYAFSQCYSLTSITVSGGNPNYQSIDGNLYTKDGKTLVQYAIGKTATEFTIPDSVQTIGYSAFGYCENLTSVVIGYSVTTISGYAFSDCTSLTSVVIPDSVTLIDAGAFEDCSSLTNIKIPNSVTTIGKYAFAWCDSLTKVVIGDGVTSIANYAFRDCDSLTSLVIGGSVTSIGDSAFDNCNSLTSVYYKGTANDWSAISIDNTTYPGNYDLINATLYYYSENQPTEEGNYWHYDENGNVVVW